MPAKNKEGRIFLLDRAKAAQTGTIWLSVFQEEKTVRDLVSGTNLANPGGFSIDEGGSVATFNGAQQQNIAFVVPASNNTIIAARVKATAAQAANPGAAFGIYASSGNQSGFGVGFDTANSVGCTYIDNSAAGTLARSAGSLNKWYTVFVQHLDNRSTYAWINGKPATTGQGSTHPSGFSTINEISIGAQHRSAGFLRQFKGNIEWAAILNLPVGSNNVLTDDYAEYLYESNYPYSLEAKPSRIWVGGGGTGTPVNPGVGTIALTGYAPSIAQTANQAVAPDVGNIIITGYAPTISQPQAVNPGAGTITITGYAPTVTQNVDVPINPGVGTIAITGYAPTVAQTANQSITPDAGNITITGYAPSVDQSANQDVTPDAGLISITGYAPTVEQAAGSPSLTPGVGTITITGYAPTVEQSSPLRLGGFEYGSKVYIKRNKKIYIFDSVEEADSYIEAESKVEEIVQQSNKTSRLARKRAREKAHKLLSIEPVESVDIPALKTLVSQLQTGFELPQLIAKQDWQRVVEIYQQAMEMQDEEDLLLIL